MLTENKFTKYLLYAIGEIVLVVIGILIALSINNWNENKKTKAKEVNVLEEIKRSLEEDLDGFQMNIGTLQLTKNACINIQKQFHSKNPPSDSTGIYFAIALFKNTFEYSLGPYESLKSDGVSLISNDTIRKQIIRVYEESYPTIDKALQNTYLNDDFVQEYCATLFDKVSLFGEVEKNSASFGRITPHNYEKLKNDKLYNTIIETKIEQSDFLIHFVFETHRDLFVKPTIHNLEGEISRLKKK